VLLSPNAGGIAVDHALVEFRISLTVQEIFAVNVFEVVRNLTKFCMFLAFKNFWVAPPPKFWTGIIKFGLLLTIVQNFAPIGHGAQRSRKKIKKSPT